MPLLTARGVPYPEGDELVSQGNEVLAAMAAFIESLDQQNTFANRPDPDEVPRGTLFFATDTGFVYRSNGVDTWTTLGSDARTLTNLTAAAAGDKIIRSRRGTDANDLFGVEVDGTHRWGPGTTAFDAWLARVGVATLRANGILHADGVVSGRYGGAGQVQIGSDAARATIAFGNLGGSIRHFIGYDGGNPEGVVTANPGTVLASWALGRLYVKESGVGNTGWRHLVTALTLSHTWDVPTPVVAADSDDVIPGIYIPGTAETNLGFPATSVRLMNSYGRVHGTGGTVGFKIERRLWNGSYSDLQTGCSANSTTDSAYAAGAGGVDLGTVGVWIRPYVTSVTGVPRQLSVGVMIEYRF